MILGVFPSGKHHVWSESARPEYRRTSRRKALCVDFVEGSTPVCDEGYFLSRSPVVFLYYRV